METMQHLMRFTKPFNLYLELVEQPGTCRSVEFTCSNSSAPCTLLAYQCDGFSDCTDNSDEIACGKYRLLKLEVIMAVLAISIFQ